MKEGKTTSDQCDPNPKKTRWTGKIMAVISAAVESDRRPPIHELAATWDLPYGTVPTTLTEDLGLVKKLACWGPILLSRA
jgi:hypothetical protein